MKRNIWYILVAVMMLMLSGCGSNDKIDGDGTTVAIKAVALENQSLVLDDAKKNFSLTIPVTKELDKSIGVRLEDFKLSVPACPVASVTYAPSSLSMEGDKGSKEYIWVSGSFVDTCADASYDFSATQVVTDNTGSTTDKISAGSGNAGGSAPSESGYSFYNATTPMEITQANKAYEVKVQVLEDGYIAEGKTVRAKPFDATYGTIANPATTTGKDGYAVFDYTSPAIMPANGSSVTIELTYDNNGTTLSQNIVLNFQSNSSGGAQFELINESNITVTAAKSTKEITIDLVDSATGVGVPGKDISIQAIDAKYGSISPSTTQTDSAGKAIFNYTAPAVLIAGTERATVSFTDDLGQTITKYITITISPAATGGSKFALINATNDINIQFAGERKEIAVQLIDASTQIPQAGKIVTAKSISADYGRLESATATTGTDGYARFTYIAADPLKDGHKKLEIIYIDADGVEVNASVEIVVNGAATTSDYNITSVTSPIEINRDNEVKTISAVVVDSAGVGVKDIDVSITAISDIKYGSIISASTAKTDSSGRASFTYAAPDNVALVDGNSTTPTLSLVSNGVRVEESVTISFNKIEDNITRPRVVISNNSKDINLTQNLELVNMEIKVFADGFNTPYTDGKVKVELPQEVLDGVDIGYFDSYSVDVGSNGIATFVYHGPQNLKELIDGGYTDAIFSFSHEDNSVQSEEIKVHYAPDNNYTFSNYILSMDGNMTMVIERRRQYIIALKDDQGNLIPDDRITEIKITSKNDLIGKLVDADNGGIEVSQLLFVGDNAKSSKSFTVQTYTASGLLPIETRIRFIDDNGREQNLTIVRGITVFSGPPTALSISYVGVEQNKTVAKYTEKFAVTVTDAYNNPVNTRPYIATGALVEYAVDGSSATGERTTSSPRLWHGRSSTAKGKLEAIGGNKAQLTTTVDTFNHVDIDNDKLVTFGAGYVYEALGKWDIDSIANKSLQLKDDYNGTDREDIIFAVGHNNRQDLCADDAREYVGNMKSNTYQVDANGHVLVEFEYDYHLTGKDTVVWVNLMGKQNDNNHTGRMGEARKHTLRGAGLTPVPENGYTVPKGTTTVVKFGIHHKDAPEWYRNAKFSYAVRSGSNCMATELVSSNYFDARACSTGAWVDHDNNATTPDEYYGGGSTAYVYFRLTAPADKDCTFAIDRVTVSGEF